MEALVVQAVVIVLAALVVALVARYLSLPYTVGLMVAGLIAALLHVQGFVPVTRDVIFDLILPPLLFEAALAMHGSALRKDLVPILAFSIVGVAVAAFVVTAGMAVILHWDPMAALLFGVLIAATDPVAVLAMFKDAGVGGRLRTLVEAESLFNDGVAAALFVTVLAWTEAGASGFADGLRSGAVAISLTVGGGIIAGSIVGAAALAVWAFSDDALIETALTLVVAYGAFLLAEHFHVSGVLATVVAGLVLGNVGVRGERPFLSARARKFVLEFWEFAAFIANSFVFLMIGVTVGSVPFSRLGIGTIVITIGVVLASRVASVYPIALAFFWTTRRISVAEQHVLVWAGLRGALGLALALSLPAALPYRDEIQVATFAVAAFSIGVQGLTMPILLRFLGISAGRSSGDKRRTP